MNPWELLEISPTVDVKRIKLAYAALIKKNNPDDNPVAFQKLREAYEFCLDESRKLEQSSQQTESSQKKPENDETDQPPKGIRSYYHGGAEDQFEDAEVIAKAFADDFVELYQDFHRRIDISSWKRLFNADAMQRLDVRELLNIRLFSLIADHPNLPKEVYELLDRRFNWPDQQIEFSNIFPEQMIDLVFWHFHHAVFKHDYLGLKNAHYIDFDAFIALREEGAYLLARNDMEKAGVLFKQAFEIYSEDPVLLYLLGQHAERCSDHLTAVDHYSKMIATAPDRIEGYLYRAYIYLKQNKTTEAFLDFQRILEQSPEHIEATKGLAQCHEKIKNLEEAKLLYELCIEKRPADLETIIAIEMLNERLIHIYANANDSDLNLIKKLARCYMETGQSKKARKLLDKCNTPDSEIYLICGQAVEQQRGSFKKADNYYKKALETARLANENGYEVLIAWGNLLFKNDRKKDAELIFMEAWKINPNNAEVADMIARAIWYADDGRDEEALIWADQAVSIEPERWVFRQTKGTLLFKEKRYREAIKELDLYIETMYYSPFERFMKGLSHYFLGQYEEAADALSRAQKMDMKSTDEDAPFYLALSYYNIGQLEQAYSQAHIYEVDCFEKYYLRGFLEFKLGHIDNATANFNIGLKKYKDWDNGTGLVCCYMKQNDYQSVLDLLNQIKSEDAWALFNLTAVYCLKSQWQTCLETSDRYFRCCTKDDKPVDSDIFYYRAFSYYYSNNKRQAIQEIKKACSSNSFKIQAMLFTSMLHYELGQFDAAIQILSEQTCQGKSVDLEQLINEIQQSKVSDSTKIQKISYETYFPEIKKILPPPIEPDPFPNCNG